MGQRGRHAAPGAGAQKVRRAVAVVLAAGALTSVGAGAAAADVLDDLPLNGEQNIDQEGQQNLDCGNSARIIRLNVGETVHHDRFCVERDGRTRHLSGRHHGALAEGGAGLGPQVNAAQAGEQNLYCGNSADLITVNVTGDVYWNTTCVVTDPRHPGGGRRHGAHTEGARAVGGTNVGPQVNTAQSGRQNLYCGNSADTLTLSVAGTVSKRTTCTAAQHSSHGPGDTHFGRASVRPGDAVGPETNDAQNGRQNQTCGNPGTGLDVPLGQITRQANCTVHAGA
ncbi:hypothetical protein ACFW88_34395 [Streptomyces anandii]|uniref:Secreted protein n=1 Tax=Streptomyces anandii TaxID=285454 RepID=A0ABW6HH71_9ACTN